MKAEKFSPDYNVKTFKWKCQYQTEFYRCGADADYQCQFGVDKFKHLCARHKAEYLESLDYDSFERESPTWKKVK